MVRRPLRPHLNVSQALDKLKQGRAGALDVGSGKGFNSPEYVVAHKVTAAIDELAEMLTGDPTYFHLKGHSGPPHSGSED